MKDNYLLSGLWLAATVGGIIYLGYNGTISAQAEAEAHREAMVREEMVRAIDAGHAGRFADAARMLEALQAEHPDSTSVMLNLGLAYRGLELYDQADAQFQKVLAANPKDWDAVAEHATILKIKGQEQEAFEQLEKVPPGEGQVLVRLTGDPDWAEAGDAERLTRLRTQHGGGARPDTAVRRLQEMDRRRKEFEAANGSNAAPAPEAPQH